MVSASSDFPDPNPNGSPNPFSASVSRSRTAAARFAEILDTNQAERKLDEAIVTLFAAPNSYTGEDIVEIAAHGSPVVLEYLVRHALTQGARLARPGEFTEQAFLGGRIDLTQG